MRTIKRSIVLSIAVILFFSFGFVCVAAVWDGSGDAGSGGSLEEITGNFWLHDVG